MIIKDSQVDVNGKNSVQNTRSCEISEISLQNATTVALNFPYACKLKMSRIVKNATEKP